MIKHRKVVVGLAIALVAVVFTGTSAMADSSDNAQILNGSYGVNYYRAQAGVAAISEDAQLSAYAQERADQAVGDGYLAHDVNFWYNRLNNSGSFAELLAQNLGAASVATAWHNSGAHNPFMISNQYVKAGVGYAVAPGGQRYSVLILLSASSAAPTSPQAPVGASLAYASGQLTATWTAPSDTGSAPLSGYIAYLYEGGSMVDSKAVSSSTATFTTLNPGSRYTVRVVAKNTSGQVSELSTFSNEVAAPAGVASAVQYITAYASGANITAYWFAPATTNGASVSGYRVNAYRDGALIDSSVISGTSYALASPGSGSYTIEVSAINAAGSSVSAASQPVVIQSQVALAAPDRPQNLKFSTSATSASASWGAPYDGGSSIFGYLVKVYVNNALVKQETVSGTSYTTSVSASGSSTVRFSVAARNGIGDSLLAEALAYTQVIQPAPAPSSGPSTSTPVALPSAPAPVQASPATDSKPAATPVKTTPKVSAPAAAAKPAVSTYAGAKLFIRWAAPKSNGAKLDRYQVRVSIGSSTKIYTVKGSAKSFTLTKLAKSKVAKIVIRAHNARGWGAYSPTVQVKTKR